MIVETAALRSHSSILRTAQYQALPAPRKTGLFHRAIARLFGRAEVTTFHRCLALHMHVAAQRNTLG